MEVTLANDLQDTIVLQTVQGPDVAALFAALEITPSTDTGIDADLVEKIKHAELVVAEAKADAINAAGLSTRVHSMIADAAAAAEHELQTLLGKHALVDNIASDISFEALDKLRADATQNMANWQSRVNIKVQDTKESLAISITGAQNAIAALQEQISTLHSKHDDYADQWYKANCLVRTKMQNRIAMLEEKCRLAKPWFVSSNAAETDVMRLQAQVADLLAQLAKQAAQAAPMSNPGGSESVSSNTVQIEGTVTDSSGDSPMQIQDTVDNAATGDVQSGTAACKGKGKGKGKDDNLGNY
jgi:hypothetical protein